MDDQIKLTEAAIKEASDIMVYCIEHIADFNMVDQIQFVSSMLKFGNELKPLYFRNAAKDENEKFIVKL